MAEDYLHKAGLSDEDIEESIRYASNEMSQDTEEQEMEQERPYQEPTEPEGDVPEVESEENGLQEVVPGEREEFYEDLFDSEMADILAAQEAKDKAAKKKAAAQKARKARQQKRDKERALNDQKSDATRRAEEVRKAEEARQAQYEQWRRDNEARYASTSQAEPAKTEEAHRQEIYRQGEIQKQQRLESEKLAGTNVSADEYRLHAEADRLQRQRAMDEQRRMEEAQREQQRRMEVAQKEEARRQREAYNTGRTNKMSHLDLRGDADNTVSMASQHQYLEYEYRSGGRVEPVYSTYGYGGAETSYGKRIGSERAEKLLATGAGTATYTLNGVNVEAQGYSSVPDKTVNKPSAGYKSELLPPRTPRNDGSIIKHNSKFSSDMRDVYANKPGSYGQNGGVSSRVRDPKNQTNGNKVQGIQKLNVSSKYDQYKHRFMNPSYLYRNPAYAVATMVISEGVRDGGAENVAEAGRDIQEVALITFYRAKASEADRLIRQTSNGQFKTVEAVRKFDKGQTQALKGLTAERNQLIAQINMSVGAEVPLKSLEDVSNALARNDISNETREKLKRLQDNMYRSSKVRTFMQQNADSLDKKLGADRLGQFGVKSVGQLNNGQLNALYKQLTGQAARNLEALRSSLSPELAKKLGVKNVSDFTKMVKSGQVARLLQSGKLTVEQKKLLLSAVKNLKLSALLKTRMNLILTGIQDYRKISRIHMRALIGRKIQKQLRNTDVDGLSFLADSVDTVREVRYAARLAKNSIRVTRRVVKATPKVVKAAGKAAGKVAGKVVSSGRKLVDNQVRNLVLGQFNTGAQVAKSSVKLANTTGKTVKKGLDVVRKATLKVANTAKNVFAAAKAAAVAAVHAVAAAGHAIAGLIAAIPVIAIPALIIIIVVVLFLIILTVFAVQDSADIQKIVDKINTERDEVVLDTIYDSFKGETDPFGHPYGYTTLDGKTSDNMVSGVTWEYADGVSNNTAEIISLAAVYFQQNWPSSNDIVNMFSSDDIAFFKFVRGIAGYGLDVTAQESHPYSCLVKGGCVLGYRSEGQTVTIKKYKTETHTCSEGNSDCGSYIGGTWHWSGGHGEGQSHDELKEDGTRDVTVYFPIIFPDGANASDLSIVPEGTTISDGGEYDGDSIDGNLILDASGNLYKGELDDWFYEPGEKTISFTVVNSAGDEEARDTYTVTFGDTDGTYTAIPWCPGELNDGYHGHYDLNCTVYLVGYDEYTEPLAHPDDPENADVPVSEDGIRGGTGTLIPLAHEINDNQLTRTVTKLNQNGVPYSGGTAAAYTASITLPESKDFTCWYDENGEDVDGNVNWAELLYATDWEELYGVTEGVKSRTFGRKFSDEEFEAIIGSLNYGDVSEARQAVVQVAIKSSGQFSYSLGSKPSGGPGHVGVKGSYDCSGFVRYCYWMAGLSFDAVNTADYPSAGDLREISASELQPGDMQVMLSSDNGGAMGHVRIFCGISNGKAMWAECVGSKGSLVNTWSNSEAGMSNCRYYTYTGF